MSKTTDNIPAGGALYVAPKYTHFTSDYVVICENDLLVSSLGFDHDIFSTPSDDYNQLSHTKNLPWWIQSFNYYTGTGIPTLDPFRAKTFRFWMATQKSYGFGISAGADLVIKPSKIDTNGQYTAQSVAYAKAGLPAPMRILKTDDKTSPHESEFNWHITHGGVWNNSASTTKKKVETGDNIYGMKVIENIHFTVDAHPDHFNESVNQDNGILCALAGSFLDPGVSIANVAPNVGNNLPFSGEVGVNTEDVMLTPAGMPAWNNSEGVLKKFCNTVLEHIFKPSSYIPTFEPSHAGLSGKALMTIGQKDSTEGPVWFQYNTRGAYRDATFTMPTFASSQAIEAVDELGSAFSAGAYDVHYADVDPVYNNLSEQYEIDSSVPDVHHTRLPNIYSMLDSLEGGKVDVEITADTPAHPAWWNNYIKSLEMSSFVQEDQKHIFVSNKGNTAPATVDEYSDLFPMYNNISFRSHSSEQLLMNALKKSGAETDLWKSIVKHLFYNAYMLEESSQYKIKTTIGEKHIYSPYAPDGNGGVTGHRLKGGIEKNTIISQTKQNGLTGIKYNNYQGTKMGTFNFDKWLENYPEDVDEYVDSFLGTNAPSLKEDAFKATATMAVPQSEKEEFKNPLLVLFGAVFTKANLLPEIRKIAQQKVRSHVEVFDGKKAYSEVLFYRIEKIYNGDTIQNFWIENTPGASVLRYVDTQVKYDEEYKYKIYAYTAVIGTKYRYAPNADAPKVIDYFQESTNLNTPYMFTFDAAAWTQALNDYNAGKKPHGNDFTPTGRIIYPTLNTAEDKVAHANARWADYVSKYPAFQAIDSYYNTMVPLSGVADTWFGSVETNINDLSMSLLQFTLGDLGTYAANNGVDFNGITALITDIGQVTMLMGQAELAWDPSGAGGPIDMLNELKEKISLIEGVLNVYYGNTGAFGPDYDNLQKMYDAIENMEGFLTYEFNPAIGTPGAPGSVSMALDKITPLKEAVYLEAQVDVMEVFSADPPDSAAQVTTRVQAVSEPYIKVLEVPMYEEEVCVIDDPPLAPHVTFNSFAGDNSRIMFSFDNAVGEEEQVPVALDDDDLVNIDKVRRKQDRDYTYDETEYKQENKSDAHIKQRIIYKADDYASHYEIYRRLAKPNSVNDFDETDLLGMVDTSISSSHIDSIMPNTKYYYMFRTVDRHGHVSNPSYTYEIEIVDDDGAIYTLINVVDYEMVSKTGHSHKSFKRYLQLDPAFLQKLINASDPNLADATTAYGLDPKIGVLSDSIYDNKKFKVRVTSRATGKKIDINLEFKKQMDEKSLLEQP